MTNSTSLLIERLPDAPSPRLTGKYTFLDTRKVINDMADLGYAVTDFRQPRTRTANGRYGLHEVEFREPKYAGQSVHEAPRILFINSYDGSRKAQLISGIIRFACLNGLVLGDIAGNEKFLHMGDFEQELLDHVAAMTKTQQLAFDRIEAYRGLNLTELEAIEYLHPMAEARFEDGVDFDFRNFLQPRRAEDVSTDLYTRFNVVQENLIKGGVPIVNENGQARLSAPVNNIIRSNQLNQLFWNTMETTAELVG